MNRKRGKKTRKSTKRTRKSKKSKKVKKRTFLSVFGKKAPKSVIREKEKPKTEIKIYNQFKDVKFLNTNIKASYETWIYYYFDYIIEMRNILIENPINKNSVDNNCYFYSMEFLDRFAQFIYNNSSGIISQNEEPTNHPDFHKYVNRNIKEPS